MKMCLPAPLAALLPVLLLLVLLPYGAQSKTVKVVGDRVYHPKRSKEYLQTYVILSKDHTSETVPIAVGAELTSGFVQHSNSLPSTYHIDVPLTPSITFNYTAFEQFTTHFPAVGKNPFTFLYWSYGFNGHPPFGVYDVPHYDLHFMVVSPEYWWGEQFGEGSQGPCNGLSKETFYNTFKPVPASCYPGSTSGPITQVGDFVWGMGSHLFDFSAPEFNPQRTFNFTQIYGQYNGWIPFFEAMISVDTMKRSRGYKECIKLNNNPKAMPVPMDIPGELCVERKARSFVAEYRNFTPAAVGCVATDGKYGGTYPKDAPQLPKDLCPLPPTPGSA